MREFISLLTLLVLATHAVAQDKPPTIRAALYAVGYAPELQEIYLRTDAEKYEKIALSTANIIGPERPVLVGGGVSLHTIATNAEGTIIYPQIGTAKIPKGLTNVLLVLIPQTGEDGKGGYSALVIDKSDTNFKQGSYTLINFSKFPVRGAIGRNNRFLCEPGKIASFQTDGTLGEMVPVLMQYRVTEHWQRLTETRWAHSDRGRTLMCAYTQPGTTNVRIRSIPDSTTN